MSENIEVRRILCQNGSGGCYLCCGFLAYVDGKENRILRLEPNPEHPVNRGWICPDRAIIPDFAAKYLYHQGQIQHPLKRMGGRGQNLWQQVSYDSALDEIAGILKEIIAKHGPESLGILEGTFRSDCYWARARLMNLLGNPNNVFDPGMICGRNVTALHQAMVGANIRFSNLMSTKCLVMLGKNPAESFPTMWRAILMRRTRQPGTTIGWGVGDSAASKIADKLNFVVFDPRFTETARNADYWLQIRPGTDTAALLAWIYVIIKERIFDRDFVLQWTNAPFLVRDDRHTLLRENDLKEGGSSKRFVVWNEILDSPAVWDRDLYQYLPSDVKPSLEGTFQISLADGVKVTCKTVWQLLVERVGKYTPEQVAEITWLDPDQIVETARIYATSKPASICWGVSLDQIGRNASRVEQCRTILRLITGNLVDGGDPLPPPGPRGPNGELFIRESVLELSENLSPGQKRKQLGADRFKIMTWPSYDIVNPEFERLWGVPVNMSGHAYLSPTPLLWRAILSGKPYPIKALITWGANPMLWAPNSRLVYQALKSLNLDLHIVVEHVMTPTTQLADYVLPGASKSLETPFISNWEDSNPDIICGEAAIRPMGERRCDYEFWRELALRMGFGEHFPWKNKEEVSNYRLKPLGLTLKEAAQKGIIYSEYQPQGYKMVKPQTRRSCGFATITGRAEIWPAVFEELGYDPLPFYEEPRESPVSTPMTAREYSLILTTGGRFRPQFHSEYRQWGLGFREQHPDPIVDIHTDTARKNGIANGDWVWIETKRGRIRQRARVSPGIHPNVVNVQASWWYPEMPAEDPVLFGVWESNSNILTIDDPDAADQLTGSWYNRALLCKIYKAAGGPGRLA